MSTRNRFVWILQWLLGLYFVLIGIVHLIVPDGLPAAIGWMYDLDYTIHVTAGIAEILGGLGLILPALTRIAPALTPLAAVGLVVVMLGALVWHATRGEMAQIVGNLVSAALLAYVAYARSKLHPIPRRQ